jgi:hypothetical protein
MSGNQGADPDVAIANGIAVILQLQWGFVWTGNVGGDIADGGASVDFGVVLDEHAVVEDGYAGGFEDFAGRVDVGSVENDVVGLPLPRWARSIHERWILAVDGGSLTVGVGFVFVGIEHLNFVEPH